MRHATVIRSRDNPALKRAGAVLAGKAAGSLLLEGDRLVAEGRAAGLEFETVLVSEEREPLARELEQAGLPVRRVEGKLLARVSGLVTSPGLLAVCATPRSLPLEQLELPADALALVVAGISDPGNLGALARSAEAAGASFLALVAGGVSPWNPKALRGSMGSLLRLSLARFGSPREAVEALGLQGFRQVAAATRDGTPPRRFDWSGRVALWVGAESGALPPDAAPFERVTIPMAGRVESLNVTVAASLLLFAAGRAERSGR
jgi:TrmH family RNA methyltransferase